jgi:membrane-associated phospholipid phosphatase
MMLAFDLQLCVTKFGTATRLGARRLCVLALSSARLLAYLLATSFCAHAGDGFLGIDHEWQLDQSGIWARKYQVTLEYSVIATEIGGSLWLGKDDALGYTFWQTLDSTAISSVAAEILKLSFSRARPDQGNNPNQWFKGRCCDSFPSGEVTLQASFVTPFIANYAHEYPWIWSLELLPAYDAIARLKSQEHWQTDVIAGWVLGSAVGYWTTTRSIPLSVQILPRGLSVGFSKRF